LTRGISKILKNKSAATNFGGAERRVVRKTSPGPDA